MDDREVTNSENGFPKVDIKNWKTWIVAILAGGYIGSPFVIFEALSDPQKAVQTFQKGMEAPIEQTCNVKHAIWLDKVEGLEDERGTLKKDCGHKIDIQELTCNE